MLKYRGRQLTVEQNQTTKSIILDFNGYRVEHS